MDQAGARAAMEHYWAATDADVAHEIYHDDAVVDFPQSDERFVGVENFREWRREYPADVDVELGRIRGEGDVWVCELTARYDGGSKHFGVSIWEFRGDKVSRETIYVTEGWEAPQWRARWRAP